MALEHTNIYNVIRNERTSLVAQMVKNLSAMRETWVRSLGWVDLLEEGLATHSSILAWRIPMDRGARWATVHGITESDRTKKLSLKEGECFETETSNVRRKPRL